MPRENIAIGPSGRASRFSAATAETLSGNRTITFDEMERHNAFAFDPANGAGRNVTLPAESASKGAWLYVANTADAAEDLTVQDDGSSTIVTVSQNEAAFVWCDGESWYGLVGGNT